MPTKKKNVKKDNVKKDRVITYDKSGIKIIDKFFDVNQELPSAEMLGEIIKYRYIQKNIDTQINNYTGIIEQIDKQQTEILKNFTNTSISEFNELEKQKENYIEKIQSIYKNTLESVYNILNWLLGNEAVDYIKNKSIPMNSVYEVLYEALKRNSYISDKMNDAT